MQTSRRRLFQGIAASAALSPLLASPTRSGEWGQTVEGQRKADLGDGTYLNPIVPGDHPDPTIVKDGRDYYMTFSSFESYPGLVIWHSTDLVNWAPIGPALTRNIGTVWAVDLCKHEGRFHIYIPALQKGEAWKIWVIWADDIRGPWSDPVDLGINGAIDPGHIVGEDGRRWLFVNGIRRIALNADGLSTEGKLQAAYSPWQYPDDWITENFAPEGPKLLRHGDYFYLITAVGGTAGPVTGHMVIAARARSIDGPWEHCPYNPIVRTLSTSEPWWSRGHATAIEGPAGDWWLVYHGYENGFRTLGRQTLLEPMEWTSDGWLRATGCDLSAPLSKPKGGIAGPAGAALSDDFSRDRFGTQWSFHDPKPDEMRRIRREQGALILAGSGTSPADSSPLCCTVGDRSYRAEVSLELSGDAEAGLLLFYNHKAFVGVGFTPSQMKSFQYAEEQSWARQPLVARQIRVRLTNDENVITWHCSTDDGASWQRHPTRMEVGGIHHNVFGGFLSLKPAIYCAGKGHVKISDFRYRAGAA